MVIPPPMPEKAGVLTQAFHLFSCIGYGCVEDFRGSQSLPVRRFFVTAYPSLDVRSGIRVDCQLQSDFDWNRLW